MRKRLVKVIVLALVIVFSVVLVSAADNARINDGEQNLSNTMRYFAFWAERFGTAAMFFGVITIAMAYRMDNPGNLQKGIAMLVIGAACTQSTLVLTAVKLIV